VTGEDPAGASALLTALVAAAAPPAAPALDTDRGAPDGRFAVVLAASFARPADTTAYASGDLVANSVTAGSVVPVALSQAVLEQGRAVQIERLTLSKTGASTTSAAFRVHLFVALPAVTGGDNAAIVPSIAPVASFDVTMDRPSSAGPLGVGVPVVGSVARLVPQAGMALYALVEARAAYAPASAETFALRVEAVRL
jgi:hypothetical protein